MMGDYGSLWLVPYLVSLPNYLHPYVYVANNPVNLVDPSGLLLGSLPGSPPGLLPEWVGQVGTGVGKGVKIGVAGTIVLGAYYGVECARCLLRARDIAMKARQRLLALCAFDEWRRRVRPGAECIKLCTETVVKMVEKGVDFAFKLPRVR
jgi:hypothetical protein